MSYKVCCAHMATPLCPPLGPEAEAVFGMQVDALDEGFLKMMCYQARGSLAPMCAVIGGTAAQEVMKACTGKFMPVKQWMYFDSLESLPESGPPTEADCAAVCFPTFAAQRNPTCTKDHSRRCRLARGMTATLPSLGGLLTTSSPTCVYSWSARAPLAARCSRIGP